jgi:hypothetical protein
VQDTTASGTAEEYRFSEEKLDIAGSGPYQTAGEYVRVDTLGKDDLTPADVAVTDVSGTLLARIAAHAYDSQYRQLELLQIPLAGTQIAVNYIARPPSLIENYQVPAPAVDVDYLTWYAAGMILTASGKEEEANIKLARADAILRKLIYKERNHGDKDLRAFPDPGYWNTEDQYTVPEN